MILSDKIEIKIHRTNIDHFRNLKYDNLAIKKSLIVDVKDLMLSSNYKILVKCDNCGCEKEIKYQDYNKTTKNQKENYYCYKCKSIRYKETCIDKYGVDNLFKSTEIKNKIKKTLIEKYDVDHPMKNKDILEKKKQTCIDKYGVDNPMKSEYIKNKAKQTNLSIYGFDNVASSNLIKDKMRKTNLEKYGVEYCFQNKDIYDKFRNTMIERYGFDNAMAVNDFYEKNKKSGLKKYYFKNTDLHYQGKYELDFLEKYYDKIKIQNGKSIKYLYENKNKWYYSDFWYEEKNLIIEIKSSYWYNKYKDKNIAKCNECLKQGYNYIVILDKNYDEFEKLL